MNGCTSVVRFVVAIATALAVVGLLTACGKGPTNPTPQPPQGPTATVTSLEIDGPDSVPPGKTAQFTAIASLSDGSTRTVTNEVAWLSNNAAVLSISQTGLVTAAHQRGEVLITAHTREASRGWYQSHRQVFVLPAGTYRLYGALTDGGVPVQQGVRVEVTGGPAAGLLGVATDFGYYYLYGVWGDTEIRVTKDGYEPQVRRIEVTSHHQTLNFDLVPSRSRPVVEGTYTLTVTASAACRAELPEEARVRTYTAVVTQDRARLKATLQGGKFLSDGDGRANSFDGAIELNRVLFSLYGHGVDCGGEFYYGSVFEELTPLTYFTVYGLAVATGAGSRYSGTLDGLFEVLQRDDFRFRPIASCRSTVHQFVLTK